MQAQLLPSIVPRQILTIELSGSDLFYLQDRFYLCILCVDTLTHLGLELSLSERSQPIGIFWTTHRKHAVGKVDSPSQQGGNTWK
jgi:hypothetical protein